MSLSTHDPHIQVWAAAAFRKDGSHVIAWLEGIGLQMAISKVSVKELWQIEEYKIYYLNITNLFLLCLLHTQCVLESNANETHGRAMERTIVVRPWLLQCFLFAATAGSARPATALLHSHKPLHTLHASFLDLPACTGIYRQVELFLRGVRSRTHIPFLGSGQEESASISQTRQGMLSFYAVTMVMIKRPVRELRKRRQIDGME